MTGCVLAMVFQVVVDAGAGAGMEVWVPTHQIQDEGVVLDACRGCACRQILTASRGQLHRWSLTGELEGSVRCHAPALWSVAVRPLVGGADISDKARRVAEDEDEDELLEQDLDDDNVSAGHILARSRVVVTGQSPCVDVFTGDCSMPPAPVRVFP
jgi:hypothetical protein